jgi:predicted Zn finger-like uncharacterized protein
MAIRITCPGCKTSLTLNEDKRGRKVRCRNCENVLNVPAANGSKRKTEDAEVTQTDRKLKVKAAPAPEEEEQDEEERRPAKKKKKGKKAKKGLSPILLMTGVAVGVVLLVGVGGSAYYLTRSNPQRNRQADVEDNNPNNKPGAPGGNQQAKVEDNNPNNKPGFRIAPRIEDGPPGKTGGKGVIQNIRGAVYRTERKSELKQLALTFNQFCDEYKGGARTKENFLIHIKNFGPIRDAVKDGYYQMNMKARLDGDNIIAYERDEDAQGHLSVRSNGDMVYVPAAQLKKELELP